MTTTYSKADIIKSKSAELCGGKYICVCVCVNHAYSLSIKQDKTILEYNKANVIMSENYWLKCRKWNKLRDGKQTRIQKTSISPADCCTIGLYAVQWPV